jgi:very-short-patch-repair endonuclease
MSDLPRNENLLANARNLRRNLTKEERHLWYDCLRFCRPRFRRQEIIGNYIADFYCTQAKLVVELDGSQHYNPVKMAYDENRTAYFSGLGITVLRFTNEEINKAFDSVCQRIWNYLADKGYHPSVSCADSSPQGEP